MAVTETDAAAAIQSYLDALDGDTRQVAPGEWGLTIDAAGWPLHVGVALREGLLRAQAEVVEPGRLLGPEPDRGDHDERADQPDRGALGDRPDLAQAHGELACATVGREVHLIDGLLY